MGTGERTVPLVDDVLALLPHLTGDEVAKVYDALPATAGAWEPHYAGPRRYSLSGTSYRALVSHDGNAWKAETWAGGYQATWHPTARAAQAACDARLEAAGVRLCGEVVRDGDRPICEVCGKPEVGRTEPIMQSDDDGLCWERRFLGGHEAADIMPALREARADRDRLRALLAAYGRAVEERREDVAADALLDIEDEAAKWREWG